jgi:hypothetical protein
MRQNISILGVNREKFFEALILVFINIVIILPLSGIISYFISMSAATVATKQAELQRMQDGATQITESLESRFAQMRKLVAYYEDPMYKTDEENQRKKYEEEVLIWNKKLSLNKQILEYRFNFELSKELDDIHNLFREMHEKLKTQVDAYKKINSKSPQDDNNFKAGMNKLKEQDLPVLYQKIQSFQDKIKKMCSEKKAAS